MLTLGITGLITAYILLALLLLSINLYSNWSWQVKAGSIIATAFFYAVTYLSLPPLLGWPTGDDPPSRFRLVGAEIVQPDKATGAKGMIYLWLRNMEDLSAIAAPRAYKLPYSPALHETVVAAKSKMNKGMQQLGEFKLPEDSNIRKVDTFKRAGQKVAAIEFYDLPDPMLPDK